MLVILSRSIQYSSSFSSPLSNAVLHRLVPAVYWREETEHLFTTARTPAAPRKGRFHYCALKKKLFLQLISDLSYTVTSKHLQQKFFLSRYSSATQNKCSLLCNLSRISSLCVIPCCRNVITIGSHTICSVMCNFCDMRAINFPKWLQPQLLGNVYRT